LPARGLLRPRLSPIDVGVLVAVRRIERALRDSSDGTLREGFFLDLLHSHYSADESRAQLDTAIDWAPYAELFEYDAG
jgi:NitT/TauT family transport system ATP-binding protein